MHETTTEFYFYEVNQGDCISSIAENAGLKWEDVWNHPDNELLREKREDPNILFPGDKVAVPQIRIKEVSAETEKRHTFVKLSNKAKVTLRLLQEGKPRSCVAYQLLVDGQIYQGSTDSGGYFTIFISPTARKGKLTVTDCYGVSEEFDVQLGHLDPINEIEGVQKRLRNLGFNCSLNGKLDELTKTAISVFRAKHNLDGNGIVDRQLIEKLQAIHGS